MRIIADRLELVGEYYFSKKLQEIEELGDPPVINLGMGNPDIPPPLGVSEALSVAVNQPMNHGYQPYRSSIELRKAIATWYKQNYAINLIPDSEILPIAGSKEGITQLSLALLNPRDEVLVPDPGYLTYTSAAHLAGAVPKPYDLTEKKGWFPDFDKIVSSGVENVKMMWVNYPHMPTGASGDKNVFQKLIEFGQEHNILICHDNPYSFISDTSKVSILSINGAKETSVELNSLSKSYNMAGWRVGMMVGKSDVIHAALQVKSNMDSGLFFPIQQAAIEALKTPTSWIINLNNTYSKRRKIVYKVLDSLGCNYIEHQAGLFVWAKIPVKYKNGDEFSDWLLEKHHIFVTPGSVFGKNGEGYVRVSLCANQETLHQVKERLA